MRLTNLFVLPTVTLTPTISRTIQMLDEYFQELPATVTSGERSVHQQLLIIFEEALSRGLEKEFLELTKESLALPDLMTILTDGTTVYWWQRAWSRLLVLGFIVNPPIRAKCLEHYISKKLGVPDKDMFGEFIELSTHQMGIAFDISVHTGIGEKTMRVSRAFKEGHCYIHSYKVEKENQALHVTCIAA